MLKNLVLAVLISFIGLSAEATETLKRVENQNVCMVTDMHFAKKQIPVSQEGKTYYGCCQNCKATLANDPKVRAAIDPISGKTVDKSSAVIAAREDNSVVYFENEKTFKEFLKKTPKQTTSKSSPEAHAH